MEENKSLSNLYKEATDIIKTAILQAQERAVKHIAHEQLLLYYGIGHFISQNTRQGHWGSGAIDNISEQLQRELPGLRGFSSRSLRYMRTFYEEWCIVTNTNSEITTSKSSVEDNNIIWKSQFPNLHETDLQAFFSIAFTHHTEILKYVKSLDERLFYIRLCATERLSVDALKTAINKDEYHHHGKIPNNFLQRISNSTQALQTIKMFKDEYLLDFINTEELGERDKEDIDERVVEQEIIHNVKKFIMTFGRDFAFVGNQYHLEVFGIDHFPDLIFFNRELNALVIVELKKGAFKPAYLGQLCTYLRLADDQIRKPHENPSIGIVLCKSANKEYVEYVIQDYDKPMGVATYKTSSDMPEKLRKALPDIEELKKLL